MVNEQFPKKLWISFGIVAVSFAIVGGALYFFAGDLSANADAIVNARAALDQQNSAVANLASLKQQAQQALQYQSAMDQLVPGPYSLVTFTQWFAEQGKQFNVSASAEFQGSATPSQGTAPGSDAFSYTATGSISNIALFLDFVTAKSSGFLVLFNSFNITGGGTNYNAQGQGTVFSQ